MGCALWLVGTAALLTVAFLCTTWLVRKEAEGVKVCGALSIASAGLLLTTVSAIVLSLISPRHRIEREALETYTSFQAAVQRNDFETAWGNVCPSYRQANPFPGFEREHAARLASASNPRAMMESSGRVEVLPSLWNGGAHVTLIRSEGRWCLLELAGWSYD